MISNQSMNDVMLATDKTSTSPAAAAKLASIQDSSPVPSPHDQSFESMDPEAARAESCGNKKIILQSSPVSEAVSLFLQSRPCHELLSMYAEKEYTLENLYFWRHISDYRKMLESGDAERVS